MQQALRPYATAGIALVGASMIAVTPMVVPPPAAQVRSVQLVDAWSDLFTETAANWQNILSGADSSAISQVYSELLTNPLGVIGAFANLTPTVTEHLTSLPATISVELPPGLELGIAGLGATGATFTAVENVVAQLQTNPSAAFEGLATILNGYLNGQDNISLLDGTINIAGFNGILAPLQDVSVNLNLTALIGALGLGNTSLSNLDLSSLLSQLGLGNLNLGSLFSDLGLSGKGLGDLLGDPSLGTLLGDLGLGNLDLGNLGLTNILSTLGLDVNLNSLSLNTVLGVFGIDPTINLGLSSLLSDLGLSSFVNESLGTLVSSLPGNLLNSLVGDLNGVLGTVLGPILNNAIVQALLPGVNLSELLTVGNLETALNGITVADLMGGQSIDATVSTLLGDLGVSVPNNLTIGGILEGLGAPSTIGGLSLSDLLGGLNLDNLSLGSLLNTVNLGDLLGDLGLSNLPVDLTNLGDLSGLTLGGLLGDLGLGNIASISVEPIGGFYTELVDVVPQQILAALGI
jgi:hypothetical protein